MALTKQGYPNEPGYPGYEGTETRINYISPKKENVPVEDLYYDESTHSIKPRPTNSAKVKKAVISSRFKIK